MKKEDVIAAAFKVWGRDLYQTTSLTKLAQELKVSKPALYRHFKDKDAILDAMNTVFFDDCAAFIRGNYEKAISVGDRRESGLIMMRTLSEFYVRNIYAFIFSLTRVFGSRNKDIIDKQFRDRGIDFSRLVYGEESSAMYPSKNQLIMVTVIFYISQFHRKNFESGVTPTEDNVRQILDQIEKQVQKGLELDSRKVTILNFELLEQRVARTIPEDTEENKLLRAVAEAVAEAGPWSASMEMVARRSGLSKSGLYAHFKNKQDMLAQLFITEFTRIFNFAKIQIETSEVSEEQLYLAIISIVNYLRTRPEILEAIGWIKTMRLELGKEVPKRLSRIISGINLEAVRNYDQRRLVRIAQWILFLIVNTLAWWPGKSKVWAKHAAEVPNESIRILFRFVALGLEGINS